MCDHEKAMMENDCELFFQLYRHRIHENEKHKMMGNRIVYVPTEI